MAYLLLIYISIMKIILNVLIFSFIFINDVSAERIITSEDVQVNLDIVWICIATVLVFFMKAGFIMVEIGFTRAKSAVNAIMKNMMDFAVSSIVFWAVGFGIMFGTSNGLFGIEGFFLHDYADSRDPWLFAFWMYQLVFVSSTAAIVSGAMAGRTGVFCSLMFTVFMSAFIYPIFGSWVWGSFYHGEGWLEKLGFTDFAGSTVIHAIGGWAGLAGAMGLGPPLGRVRRGGGL